MQKLRYEVDPHNRLVVSETGEKSDLTRFRRVLDGRFKTGCIYRRCLEMVNKGKRLEDDQTWMYKG